MFTDGKMGLIIQKKKAGYKIVYMKLPTLIEKDNY